MGDNWQEECRNGTMSLLSEISQSFPALEAELLRLNQEARDPSERSMYRRHIV